VITDHIAVA